MPPVLRSHTAAAAVSAVPAAATVGLVRTTVGRYVRRSMLAPYPAIAAVVPPVAPDATTIDAYARRWRLPPYGPSVPQVKPKIEAHSAGYDQQDFQDLRRDLCHYVANLMDADDDHCAHDIVNVDVNQVDIYSISLNALDALLKNPPIDVKEFIKILLRHCPRLPPLPAFETMWALFLCYHQHKAHRAGLDRTERERVKLEKDAQDTIESAEMECLQYLWDDIRGAIKGIKKEASLN
ncbi:hypothetical protein C8J57DRAFT_1538050 [Mycena rebaudengoi]|nr:hypothetical protein C8J57DRAFT_1538050 [Mycena rebaudengoi]